jgi:hypothetical protein
MNKLTDNPWIVFALALFVLWLSARIGSFFLKRRKLEAGVRQDFSIIADAAGHHYRIQLFNGYKPIRAASELRGSRANAIGTEYLRADLLPAADAARVHALLRNYVDERILFYNTRDEQRLRQIDATTAQLQIELWNAIHAQAAAQPTPVVALVISGMNDVLNSQGSAQAAWWNRIPIEAWGLMGVIAICCNLLVGYSSHRPEMEGILMFVLPIVVAISFFLIADIDSPRVGVIRVQPQNLVSVAQSFQTH